MTQINKEEATLLDKALVSYSYVLYLLEWDETFPLDKAELKKRKDLIMNLRIKFSRVRK